MTLTYWMHFRINHPVYDISARRVRQRALVVEKPLMVFFAIFFTLEKLREINLLYRSEVIRAQFLNERVTLWSNFKQETSYCQLIFIVLHFTL